MEEITMFGLPAPFFTHPGVTGAPQPADYPDLGVYYDPDGAKILLDEYLKERNKTAAQLNIVMMYNTSDANKKIAEAMQTMWKNVLDLNVVLEDQEWTLFRETRVTGKENIYRATWKQEYPDANNFLWDLFGTRGIYRNIVNWPLSEKSTQQQIDENKNPAYDQFLDICQKAAIESDLQKRTALYAQAEQILAIEEAVLIPLHWYAQEVLIQPQIDFVTSITGIYHYEKWDIKR
jgi:oligopeptide transport system substrate-binding protein